MDKNERAQVRLLLDHARDECVAEVAKQQVAMFAEHSAHGRLRSGATVQAAIRIAEGQVSRFVQGIVASVGDVAQDTDAFAMVLAEATTMLTPLRPGIDEAVSIAAGGLGLESLTREANRLFNELEQRTLRLVEIHRFTFVRPPPSQLAVRFSAPDSKHQLEEPTQPAKNKGGKPIAAHWDAMWATIAVQLWSGDLKPKTQADIKRAMLDWFNANEIDVGDTAVTDRARQLWQKIETAK